MYERGLPATQDYAEAARWYGRGAKQANADAQARLGALYANGRGVPQHNVVAHMWLNLAGAWGKKDAAVLRERTEKMMSPEQIV